MCEITIHLVKPGKNTTLTYSGMLLSHEQHHLLIHARWERGALDLGYVIFEPEDHFYEHYYTDRWFNIFEIRQKTGQLKGWYCNVTRPAVFVDNVLTSEDLELDLFVSPDRERMLRLDLDEFETRNFDRTEPETYKAALRALDELEQMARTGMSPFDSGGAGNSKPAPAPPLHHTADS